VLDHTCDFKMTAGMTHGLEVGREGDGLDCSYDYKTRAGTTYSLEEEWQGAMSGRD
jgi:hypothetical protein